jgi:hypothetical protein
MPARKPTLDLYVRNDDRAVTQGMPGKDSVCAPETAHYHS